MKKLAKRLLAALLALTLLSAMLPAAMAEVPDVEVSGDITYYISAEDTVPLRVDDFRTFYEENSDAPDELSHVKFDVGSAANYGSGTYGYLYESAAVGASEVSSDTKYCANATSAQKALDDVVFTAGTQSTIYVTSIPFTVFGINRGSHTVSVDGTLLIRVNDKGNVTVSMKANEDGCAVFSSDEFRKAIQETTGATPTTVKLMAQRGGTLYKNADSTAQDNALALGSKVYCYKTEDLTGTDTCDAFGRPCTHWKLGEEEIGCFVEPLQFYTTAVTSSDILRDCALADGTAVDVYTNGVKDAAQLTLRSENPVTIGGQGTLTEVYKDRIIVIDTFLAMATKVVTEVRDADDGHVIRVPETTLQVWDTMPETRFAVPDVTHTYTFPSDEYSQYDMLLVTIADGLVRTVEMVESSVASFTGARQDDGVYTQIGLNGEYADIAAKYIYNGIDAAEFGNDVVVYFDTDGNVIGMERYYAPLELAVVDALWVESVKGKATIKADLWTLGGDDLEEATVDSVTLGDGTVVRAADIVDMVQSGSTTWNASAFAESAYIRSTFYDRPMSYKLGADGTYTLSMRWDEGMYGAILPNDGNGPLVGASLTNGSSYVKAAGSIQFQMSEETLILIQDIEASAPYASYTAYVGYDNIPSITGKVWYHLDSETGKADTVYVYNASETGTETVIFYKGGPCAAGTMVNGKYPLEFDAYAVDPDTGALRQQTYTYRASDRNALQNAPTWFYTVYVSSKNEVSFKAVSAAGSGEVTTADATTAAGYAEALVSSVLQVRKADGSYLVLDGGRSMAAYTLSGIEALDCGKIEEGDLLYVYKNAGNGTFTIVDAVDVAEIMFVNSNGTAVSGVATDETVGHKWEGMTVLSIEEGYLGTGFAVYGYDTKADRDADIAALQTGNMVSGTEVADADKDSTTVMVKPYILIVVADDPAYTTLGLNAGDVLGLGGWGEVTTAPAASPATAGVICMHAGTRVTAAQIAQDVAAVIEANNSEAEVAVYNMGGVKADDDAELIANGTSGDNYSTWYLVITAKNGGSAKVTFTYSAPMELQSVAALPIDPERQMLDGVCFRLADGAEEGSVSYTAYDVSGAPIAMGRIVIKPAAAPPTVSTGSARVKAGKTVQIPLKLENNPGFADLSVEIAWDKSVMALESTEPTAFGGILTTSQTVQKNPYLLNWTSTQNLTYNGTLALLNFTVREDAPEGEYPVTVRYYRGIDGANRDGEDVNFDENHTAVPFAYESGTVTVLHYTPGDTTGDDKVTSRDAVYILQYLAGWDVEGLVPAAMDVDGNGRINSWDAILLLRYIAGWDIELH